MEASLQRRVKIQTSCCIASANINESRQNFAGVPLASFLNNLQTQTDGVSQWKYLAYFMRRNAHAWKILCIKFFISLIHFDNAKSWNKFIEF